MKKPPVYLVLLMFVCIFSTAKAAMLDLNLGLTQKSLSTTYDSKVSYSNIAFAFYAHLGKPESSSGLMLGWSYNSFSHNENITGFVDQTITSSDTGPAYRYYLQRDYLFYSLSAAYGIVTKGNYKSGATEESISGESYMVKASLETRMTERFYLGFSLNMYSANYKISVVNSVQSDVSYKDSWTYPALSLGYLF